MPLTALQKFSRRFIRTPGQQLLALGILAALFIALLMYGLALASGSSGTKSAIDPKTKTVTIALSQEPPNLDSSLTADTVSGFVLGHVMEGLLRFDQHYKLAPGIAERWEITATGATFWLRKDALWSDGKPVTTHDFVFAWRRVVDPKYASEYANIMSGIRNADAINAGKLPATALGVQAVNDYELHVDFVKPVPYFAQLMAFNVFFPIREDFFKSTNGRYAADADKLLYNGPFIMTKWVHGAHIRLERNPRYWDRQRVKINALDIPYFTTDPNALSNLFRDGQIATTTVSQENLEEAQLLGWHVQSFADGALAYIEFNHRKGRIGRNLNFRKALQYALNPSIEVNKVIKLPAYEVGRSLFPVYLPGINGTFRKEYPAPVIQTDPVKARKYLALAKKQLGLKQFPPLMLLTGDTPLSNRVAEYYQDTLKRQLGLDIRIDSQIFKQRLAKSKAGDFDILMTLWGADYNDPLTFGDLFLTGNVNNRGQYSDPELDQLIRIAQNSNDQHVRMAAFAKIQQLIADKAVILPEYERTLLYVVDPRLKGMVRRLFGPDPDFSYAEIEGS